jgi:hypothetical protein
MKATQVGKQAEGEHLAWNKRECIVCGKKTYFPYAYKDSHFCFCSNSCHEKYFQPLMKEK